ncbi:IS5/IS1182 family transposase, partial [Brevibacillus laterosporus]
IQYLFGIKSMRQTIKELETNVAYRWFIGYDFTQPIPHFSTFGKNYARRFQDTDLFETIFAHILGQALKHRFVDPSVMFIDSTHVKANANKKKYIKTIVEQEPKKYLSYLTDELNQDRIDHGKKPLPKKSE